MSIHARIAELHEQLATAYRELAAAEQRVPVRKEWMNLREFAAYSGKGESTIRKHIAEGMPCKRIPQIRINPDEGMSWLASRRPPARLTVVSGKG